MDRSTLYVGVGLMLLSVVSCAFNQDKISCCNCMRMTPSVEGDLDPQILPSPFVINVDPKADKYSPGSPGLDINVNLTSIDESRGFRSFMIQARRTNKTLNTVEPIGSFTPLKENTVKGMPDCLQKYGSAFLSTDLTVKKTVDLAWNPPATFQGHVEFRATFIEDENTYWVKEKSRPIYDSRENIPPEGPPKYIVPPIKSIDVAGCGASKGCYRQPEGCSEVECEYIVTWENLGKRMRFEMSALTDLFNDRYVALGLSDDIHMGKDYVFECVHNSSNGRVYVYQSWNVEDENRNIRLVNPKAGITSEEGSYNNGRLRCRFERKYSLDADDDDAEEELFNIREYPWHLLVARGPAYEGNIMRHGLTMGHLPIVSPDKVDFIGVDDISGRARYHLVKAHACLMLIAWIFFAPIGLIWMKYYTTMWPNSRYFGERYWFVAHFNCTFWVVLLVVIGVILIFIEAGGWSTFPDLPQRAHPILGIIVFISVLVIPIIALIRCPEDHTCRPVGNWFYWLFWTIAFCLAIPAIFIGMDFGKAMVPWWLTWILCIFFIFNLVCEVILEVHQCCTHKKNKERRKKFELQKKENPNLHIKEPWPAGRNFKRNVLYTHFIVCLIVVIIAVITVAVVS